MIWTRLQLPPPRTAELVLLGWALASLALAFLPTGVGGSARALNAIVFLVFGPGCAVMIRLVGRCPIPVCSVIALAVSLTVLILASQVLLIIGAWSAPGVAGLVAVVTVTLGLVPHRTAVGERGQHG